jgi:S1-C subfamily serine protease
MITASSGNGNLPSQPAYAIPVNTALDIVHQIESGTTNAEIFLGQVGYIGITAQSLNAGNSVGLGLSVSVGVLVISVNAGSPAEGAGITSGSVIVEAAGKTITTENELRAALHVYKPGAQVLVKWVDSKGAHSATLTLTSGPVI